VEFVKKIDIEKKAYGTAVTLLEAGICQPGGFIYEDG